MPGGRPGHDREAIAERLIEWAKRPDSINLNKFCCTQDPPLPPSTLLRWKDETPKFREAYETAKAFLGARREEMLNLETLHVKAYDLNATNYDLFLREEKRNQLEFESSLKSKENSVYSQESAEKYSALMNQLSAMQSPSKSCESSNNKDNKS